jgi:hypothetical protein
MDNNTHQKYTPEDIIQYLLDEMPADTRIEFEHAMTADAKLQNTVTAFKNQINKGILTANIQQMTQATLHPTLLQRLKKLPKTWIASGIAALLILGFYFFYTKDETLLLPPIVSVAALDSLPVFECPTDAIPQDLVNDKKYTAAADAAQDTIAARLAENKAADISALQLIVGVCTVQSADYASSKKQQNAALAALNSIQNKDYQEQVLCYTAIINIRLGHTEAAKTALTTLLNNPEFTRYKSTAEGLLKAL